MSHFPDDEITDIVCAADGGYRDICSIFVVAGSSHDEIAVRQKLRAEEPVLSTALARDVNSIIFSGVSLAPIVRLQWE